MYKYAYVYVVDVYEVKLCFPPQVEFTELLRITRLVLYGGGRFNDAYISKFYVMYSNTTEHLRVYADQAGLYKVNPHYLSKRE